MANSKPYHREDLREELLEAGRAYIALHGHNGLSIRTLAQQVGVSPGAPYHHFPDRRQFLLALAIEGFKDLIAASADVLAAPLPSDKKLLAMGMQFIDFADSNPRLLDLMYESELTAPTLDPELLRYQIVGHDALNIPIASSRPDLAEDEIELRNLVFWSTIYGFASMRRKGIIHAREDEVTDQNFAVAAVLRKAVESALAP
ncbi:TetR/AcrR family transcriptional regulator [Sphingomonas sp. BAUL-RG-20F-R05-02]|uniref:TetR/AcrR family transcriptional regulator n=1 Tax=Sphingomonas sp. BAUL-RG-20F-R05-02 TaxID=2914830 RepID=UPI001F5623CD|nr:TetR/AcrR family transcriptional regulator [Sphingomonas sp. BAUL-RG-20F-R05-02]